MTKQTELESGSILILPLVHLDFTGDPIYVWGGVGDLSWNGQTWSGVGALGNLDKIKADAKAGIQNMTLTLHGFEDEDAGGDSSALTALKSTTYKGKDGYVYLGYFENDGKTLVSGVEPDLLFAGRIAALTGKDTQDGQAVEVALDSFLALMSKDFVSMLGDDEHQRFHSGDTFFDHVTDAINKIIYWGLTQTGGSTGGGGAYGGGPRSGGGGGYLRQR